jgi:hypothetical protein
MERYCRWRARLFISHFLLSPWESLRGEMEKATLFVMKEAEFRRMRREPCREASARSWEVAVSPLEPDYWAGPESPDVSRPDSADSEAVIGCDKNIELLLGQSQ